MVAAVAFFIPLNFSSNSMSTLAQWRSIFSVKLDAMHRMLRIGREMNAEHPRRKKFLIDLSQAAVTPLLDAATPLSSTHSTTAVTPVSQLGSGPMPPKFNKSDMQSPTRAEIRSIRIGLKTSPGKLDLIV